MLPKILVGVLTLLIGFEWWCAVRDVKKLDALSVQMEQALHVKPRPVLKPVTKHKAVDALLFGTYIPEDDEGAFENTPLNISIIGIVYSPDGHHSEVMLEISGEEHVYREGDKLPGGARIKRITPDGVLLLRQGKVERLNLPKHELNFEPQPTPLTH